MVYVTFVSLGIETIVVGRKTHDVRPFLSSPVLHSQGSVFAEFKRLSDVEAFLKMEPKPEFQGEPVVAMTK